MNRRNFFKTMIAGVAVVAIELRVARGFPAVVSGGSTVRSAVVGPYRYFMDLADVYDVSVYGVSDEFCEQPIPIDFINALARTEHAKASGRDMFGALNTKHDRYIDDSYYGSLTGEYTPGLDLCAEIKMSQGMRLSRETGMVADGSMDYAYIPCPQINA